MCYVEVLKMKTTKLAVVPDTKPKRLVIAVDKKAVVDWNPTPIEQEDLICAEIPVTLDTARGDKIKGKYPNNVAGPYLKAGLVTVLSAKKSLGKTTISTYIAAKVGLGINPFTSEKLPQGRQKAIIYSLEDSRLVTKKRYQEFHGNPSQVHIFDKDSKRYFENLDTIADDIRTAKPGLVIIDSLAAFFGTTMSPKKIEAGFSTLERIISDPEIFCTILIIHHPSKEVKSADHWAGGTGRIENYARVGYYIAKTSENERLFMTAKFQYGQALPSFGFSISKTNGHLDIAMTGPSAMDIDEFFEQRKGKGCKDCGAKMVCSLGCDEAASEE